VEILRRELVGFPWMSHNVWATYVCVCKIIYIYISLSLRVCAKLYSCILSTIHELERSQWDDSPDHRGPFPRSQGHPGYV
jgi:hypothetical protein